MKKVEDRDDYKYVVRTYKLAYREINEARQRKCYCEKCGDTGLIPAITYDSDLDHYYFAYAHCKCRNREAVKAHISASGIARELEYKNFKTFKTETEYQKTLKKKAIDYLEGLKENKKPWLYIGGQTGAGKTHICIAIANRFLQKNMILYCMRWVDEIRKLKSDFGSREDFQKFKECEVLYIDDLFKSKPTDYDLGLAFELINYRDANNLITLISSEYTSEALMRIDKAIYSRIKTNTGAKFMISISTDDSKNYRLCGKQIGLEDMNA